MCLMRRVDWCPLSKIDSHWWSTLSEKERLHTYPGSVVASYLTSVTHVQLLLPSAAATNISLWLRFPLLGLSCRWILLPRCSMGDRKSDEWWKHLHCSYASRILHHYYCFHTKFSLWIFELTCCLATNLSLVLFTLVASRGLWGSPTTVGRPVLKSWQSWSCTPDVYHFSSWFRTCWWRRSLQLLQPSSFLRHADCTESCFPVAGYFYLANFGSLASACWAARPSSSSSDSELPEML